MARKGCNPLFGGEPMEKHLPMAVNREIERMKQHGGPTEADRQGIEGFSERIGSEGDILLYGGGKKGQAEELFHLTALAIAVMSYHPGGIHIWGNHYETKG